MGLKDRYDEKVDRAKGLVGDSTLPITAVEVATLMGISTVAQPFGAAGALAAGIVGSEVRARYFNRAVSPLVGQDRDLLMKRVETDGDFHSWLIEVMGMAERSRMDSKRRMLKQLVSDVLTGEAAQFDEAVLWTDVLAEVDKNEVAVLVRASLHQEKEFGPLIKREEPGGVSIPKLSESSGLYKWFAVEQIQEPIVAKLRATGLVQEVNANGFSGSALLVSDFGKKLVRYLARHESFNDDRETDQS